MRFTLKNADLLPVSSYLHFLKTLFDKEKEKAKAAKKEAAKKRPLNDDIADLPEMGGGDGKPGGKKKLSVERIYQKKSQLEHILIRPDTYIGSTEPFTEVSNTVLKM